MDTKKNNKKDSIDKDSSTKTARGSKSVHSEKDNSAQRGFEPEKKEEE